MTITMAKDGRLRAVFRPRLAPLAIAAMLASAPSHADWRIQPTLNLNESYTDNIALNDKANEKAQLISELNPGLIITGTGRRFQFNTVAQWHHFAYSNDRLDNTLDHTFDFALNGRGELLDDFLFVDVAATQTPRSVLAFGPQVEGTPYLGDNRVDVRTWRITPSLRHRFGNVAQLDMSYSRDGVDAGEFDPFSNTIGDTVSANLSSGPSQRSLGWSLNLMRQELDSDFGGDTSTEMASASLQYALTRRLALTASAGYDSYDFPTLRERNAGRNWSVGFDWSPSQRTRVNASIGRHFYGQTGRLDASHRSRHTVWKIIYGDGITTSRQQLLLPSTIDTAALLDSLFAASISDPLLRQQAVANYIRNAGLPPSLANDINYLSNRYIRQRQLQAVSVYTKGRSTAAATLFRTERIALSSQQSDSPLLGNQLANLNDNVREQGVNLNYAYKLNPRSNLNAATSYSRSRSITTGIEDERSYFRIGYTRELGKSLRGVVELRHQRGTYGFNDSSYRENAISAGISAQL
ncbi:TIGR03016 family PEP-CTERM system-associated outer membrane protein [Massilia sp. IC2-477]|uniref:TIGR03016 family PEP-CTERM system-associated outer membrane protein n=1 Tax=Massilia sp. IC2-477 TaxID=2887198 RepID=UPI001D11F655|nr:TIGR03016 family PEP-CTERM system-associated outer membrane protein [Massilia sp. IC2-477]MCC2955063.1 TIGR03016 family PEP-CTERM system-associated outer membrane protein [Massilia sp. IC2-477]